MGIALAACTAPSGDAEALHAKSDAWRLRRGNMSFDDLRKYRAFLRDARRVLDEREYGECPAQSLADWEEGSAYPEESAELSRIYFLVDEEGEVNAAARLTQPQYGWSRRNLVRCVRSEGAETVVSYGYPIETLYEIQGICVRSKRQGFGRALIQKIRREYFPADDLTGLSVAAYTKAFYDSLYPRCWVDPGHATADEKERGLERFWLPSAAREQVIFGKARRETCAEGAM